MVETPFGSLVREARQKARLTLAMVAESTQVSVPRISAIEHGRRPAHPEEAKRLATALELDATRARYATRVVVGSHRELINAAHQLLDGEPYFPVGQSLAADRYPTAFALYGKLMRAMSGRIKLRPEAEQIQKLAGLIRFDSADEVLNLTHVFDIGAGACLDAPNTRGPLPGPIVDHFGHPAGHRPHPCLVYQELAIYPQVTFGLRSPQTVDLLVWDGSRWRRWEVDGAGHDSARDPWREAELPLLTQRFRTADIERAARSRIPVFKDLLR